MLKVKDLTVGYDIVKVIRSVNFEIKEGEIVALIGSNGAGKTTIIKCLSGLLRPWGGTITFKGEEIQGQPAYRILKKGIGTVPEGRCIFPELTVKENLLIGAYTRHDRSQLNADLQKVYAAFPRLHERLEQLGGTLSGGEQQMLALARCLMSRPVLMLLDEPSMGLSPALVSEVMKLIQHLNEQEGMTILLVEQNARAALKIASRAYVLESGEFTLSGSAEELLNNENVKKAYLGVA
ncbi:MAG: ABC transporter ATP-binding protein [Firmicutes bacterium]|nr:ABC transporter ATP-binding protein [Bacillota bacterium]